MAQLEDDLVSLMSDIIYRYDQEGQMPDDMLSDLELQIFAYWNEYGEPYE